jgi:hypothetical protein
MQARLKCVTISFASCLNRTGVPAIFFSAANFRLYSSSASSPVPLETISVKSSSLYGLYHIIRMNDWTKLLRCVSAHHGNRRVSEGNMGRVRQCQPKIPCQSLYSILSMVRFVSDYNKVVPIRQTVSGARFRYLSIGTSQSWTEPLDHSHSVANPADHRRFELALPYQ